VAGPINSIDGLSWPPVWNLSSAGTEIAGQQHIRNHLTIGSETSVLGRYNLVGDLEEVGACWQGYSHEGIGSRIAEFKRQKDVPLWSRS
jgi:hypothetical protein